MNKKIIVIVILFGVFAFSEESPSIFFPPIYYPTIFPSDLKHYYAKTSAYSETSLQNRETRFYKVSDSNCDSIIFKFSWSTHDIFIKEWNNKLLIARMEQIIKGSKISKKDIVLEFYQDAVLVKRYFASDIIASNSDIRTFKDSNPAKPEIFEKGTIAALG